MTKSTVTFEPLTNGDAVNLRCFLLSQVSCVGFLLALPGISIFLVMLIAVMRVSYSGVYTVIQSANQIQGVKLSGWLD